MVFALGFVPSLKRLIFLVHVSVCSMLDGDGMCVFVTPPQYSVDISE